MEDELRKRPTIVLDSRLSPTESRVIGKNPDYADFLFGFQVTIAFRNFKLDFEPYLRIMGAIRGSDRMHDAASIAQLYGDAYENLRPGEPESLIRQGKGLNRN